MDDFMSHAAKIPNSLESLLGRNLYCDVVNYKSHPRNRIFFLRPARKVELQQLKYSARYAEDIEQNAIIALRELVKESFPRSIANFRFVRDVGSPDVVYMANDIGQRSDSRPIDFFLPRTRRTLFVRCYDQGNYVWHGTSAMIKPFMDFCLTDSQSTGGQELNPWDVFFKPSNN